MWGGCCVLGRFYYFWLFWWLGGGVIAVSFLFSRSLSFFFFFLLCYSLQDLCLEMGAPGLWGGGRGVLGQALRVTQRPWVLGRSDWEPCLGRGLGPLTGPDCQAWI